MSMVVMTEVEAAEFMHCKPSKIARLRRAGLLPFVPGRPVLIDRADLDKYLQSVKQAGKRSVVPTAAVKKVESVAEARAWALSKMAKRK